MFGFGIICFATLSLYLHSFIPQLSLLTRCHDLKRSGGLFQVLDQG
jgi:hypothetical protein